MCGIMFTGSEGTRRALEVNMSAAPRQTLWKEAERCGFEFNLPELVNT